MPETDTTRRYLSFLLGSELYALPVEQAEVVLEMLPITRVPKAHPSICGVINHRGAVVPVVDLRVSFGSTPNPDYSGLSIVILQLGLGEELVSLGLLADGVREVIDLATQDIEKVPDIGRLHPQAGAAGQKFAAGIAQVEGGFIILLDLEAVYRDIVT